VTGVQTCALPIFSGHALPYARIKTERWLDRRHFFHYLPKRAKLLSACPASHAAGEMLFHVVTLGGIRSLVKIRDQSL
jgi:hypothetical protein